MSLINMFSASSIYIPENCRANEIAWDKLLDYINIDAILLISASSSISSLKNERQFDSVSATLQVFSSFSKKKGGKEL